jgi:hypothetical protein
MRPLIIFTSLLIAATSLGVSRIGGGKVSSMSSQFEMTVSESFFDIQQIGSVVMANGPFGMFSGGQMAQQFLQIREFSDLFSSAANLNRQETEAYFTSRGWQHEALLSNSCIDIYSYKNNSTAGFVATWGAGKGLHVVGPLTDLVMFALEDSWKTIALQPGACSWK